MTIQRDLSSRVDIVEAGLKAITRTLDDMRSDMKAERKEIAIAFDSLRVDLSTRGRPFPFKEVAGSVLTTIAIIGSMIGVLNWWYDARSALMNDHLSALERSLPPGDMAVLRYRLDLIEKALPPTAAPSK